MITCFHLGIRISRERSMKAPLPPYSLEGMKSYLNIGKDCCNRNCLKGKLVRKHSKLIGEIPVFHAHGLRKFFITTLASKRVNLRASAFLEGHAPFMQHDSSYVDSDNLEELIYEEYQRVIPALSFLKDEEDFELGKRNHDLQIENTQLKQENQQLVIENKNIRDDFEKEARKVFEDYIT